MRESQYESRIRRAKLAAGLAAGKTVEVSMLAAGYSKLTARSGMIRHEGKAVRPMDHPEVRERVASIRMDDPDPVNLILLARKVMLDDMEHEIRRLEVKVARYALIGAVCGAVGAFLILLALAL